MFSSYEHKKPARDVVHGEFRDSSCCQSRIPLAAHVGSILWPYDPSSATRSKTSKAWGDSRMVFLHFIKLINFDQMGLLQKKVPPESLIDWSLSQKNACNRMI